MPMAMAGDFSNNGSVTFDGIGLPVIGRVSMDLLLVDATAAPSLAEGNWVDIDFDLALASRQSGLAQYELLTGLGHRAERIWR